MKTAKDQKINYLKYEKEHRKPAMSRILTAACLLWMFITAAAEASSASQARLPRRRHPWRFSRRPQQERHRHSR